MISSEDQITSLSDYDAIIVPGTGGPRSGDQPAESLPEWVKKRLDYLAATLTQLSDQQTPIVTLSAGTFHKPPTSDKLGRNWTEAVAMAIYLGYKGVDLDRVYTEQQSYDTIGNAFFLRTVHTDVRGWRRLLVLVNDFQAPRIKAVFDWVFSLRAPFQDPGYQITYWVYHNHQIAISGPIQSRIIKEQSALYIIRQKIAELDLTCLDQLHQWLYSQHDLYNTRRQIKERTRPLSGTTNLSNSCLDSY